MGNKPPQKPMDPNIPGLALNEYIEKGVNVGIPVKEKLLEEEQSELIGPGGKVRKPKWGLKREVKRKPGHIVWYIPKQEEEKAVEEFVLPMKAVSI